MYICTKHIYIEALSFVQKTAKRDIADDMGVEFMVDNAEDVTILHCTTLD